MAGSDVGKTQIMVAVIGVTGVLGAALIANWEKIFGPGPPRTEIKGDKAQPDTVPRTDAAENLSNAQGRAFDATTSALDDVTSKIENAAIPDVSGAWHDRLGQTYFYVQSGADYTYSWSRDGVTVGSGSGRLEGRKFTGPFRFVNGVSGTCAGEIMGKRSVSTCVAGGPPFQMILDR
jgi:hypothetical protein